MNDGAGLTPAGKLVLMLVVVTLICGAAWFLGVKDLIKHGGKQMGEVDIAQYQKQAAPTTADIPLSAQEYKYVPSQKLPPVTGTSNYQWDSSKTVVFPINVWIGWLPIVAANHGFNANTESMFYKDYGFKVQLKLIDDPVAARDAYVSGKSHVLWGTLDMIALFAPDLIKDSRTAPRVYQQIDWSNGGDGIVSRDTIKSINDLKGKTVVYAENSPSQYYLNTLLLSAKIQPREVSHKYTATAFEAAKAFVSDPSIDACVSWAPDIYKITDNVSGTKLLSSTAEASKVIADVWAVRADFARDHPDIVKGLALGIFRAMEKLEKDKAFKDQACKWMADGYSFKEDEIKDMLSDAHSTNFAENKTFFMNANNPVGFAQTWDRINFVYKQLGKIDSSVPFDQVMDFSVIQSIERTGMFASQKDTYTASFAPGASSMALEAPMLTSVIHINFWVENSDPFYQIKDPANPGKMVYYDPSVNKTLKEVAQLAAQFDKAIIQIEGHADSSQKGVLPEEQVWRVTKLSEDRAASVRDALVKKYGLPADKFSVIGKGWDEPFDASQPQNQDLNRRVEISVHQLESS